MPGTTSRLSIPYPLSTEAPNGPAQMQAIASALDQATIWAQGILSSRPVSTSGSPGIPGRLYLVVGDSTPANNNILWADTGTSWVPVSIVPKAFSISYPTDPASTFMLTTQTMAGLGITFTPQSSGNIRIDVSLHANGDGHTNLCYYQAYTGTGTPPAQLATVPGSATAWGPERSETDGNITKILPVEATGLTAGTTYWVDLAVRSQGYGGGSGDGVSVSELSVVISEL